MSRWIEGINRGVRLFRDTDFRVDTTSRFIDKFSSWIPVDLSMSLKENTHELSGLGIITGISFAVSRATELSGASFVAAKLVSGDIQGLSWLHLVTFVAVPAGVKVIAGSAVHLLMNAQNKGVDLRGAAIVSAYPAFYGPVVGHIFYHKIKGIKECKKSK